MNLVRSGPVREIVDPCREAGDEYYMQSIWHEILTYLMPDLPRAWYRKCQLTAQNIFVNIILVMIM